MNRHCDYSNSEQQCYLPANVTVSGSYLNIMSQVQTQTCGDSTHAPSTWNYTSGMVQWTSFNFQYGTIEFRGKICRPAGSGAWPAAMDVGDKTAKHRTSNPLITSGMQLAAKRLA